MQYIYANTKQVVFYIKHTHTHEEPENEQEWMGSSILFDFKRKHQIYIPES